MNTLLSRLPLECLRVFLEAARLRNFSAAGRELFITQAAVSQRIRQLEDLLGVPLFLRHGRSVSLTPQGSYLYRRVETLFDYLGETLEPFAGDRRAGTVSVAASGSVSHFWLSHQLAEFSKHRPDISVLLLTTDSMSELANSAHDLVVLYSKGDHPDWDLLPIFPETLVPAASAAYLEQHPGLEPPLTASEIAGLDLLDYSKYNPLWITLMDWFEDRGLTPPQPRLVFSSYALTLDAANQGQGVVLWSEGIPAQSGPPNRLVALSEDRLASGYHYCLGRPLDKPMSTEARELHAFLRETAMG